MTEPILVTGADRSGTTLLYTLLASHPRIMMVRRTNLWRWFDGKFGDLADPDNLSHCVDVMMRYERLSALSPDPDSIVAEFTAGEPTYGRLFEILFTQQAERLGFPRWGDKSLHTEMAADRVFAEWPEARMIHVVRDPRDRYVSVLGRAGWESGRNTSIVARWIRSTRAALRNVDRYADRYLIVRYEDLVNHPAAYARQVCEFVGEEFDPVMMELRGGDQRSREGGNSSFEALPPGVISTRSVGRYKSALPARRVAFIESVCGPLMQKLGYAPASPSLSLGDRLSRLGDLVVAAVRVPTWLMWQRYRDTRATPPDHRLVEGAPERA